MPDFVLDHEPAGFARIKVVGVGGGGCNAVDSMFDIGLQNVEFYVINSDLQALKRSKCPNRIQIGARLTQGRGCGASPGLGENCMMDAREEMIETLQGADVVFVTAGLGGGTGTGAAPVVAQIAKEMGILTVTVVTKPFQFEGPRRMKSAEEGLEKLRAASDTMIVINNQRLLDVVGPKIPMKEAFKVADNVLAQAVSSISDLVCTPGLINVDFNDIRTIMGGRGGAVMGVGVGKGENRALEAVKKATSSPLLDKIVIDGATGVLICITGGPDMCLSEVNEATQAVHAAVDPDAEIIFGAVVDESLTDTLRVTIIATGFTDDYQRQQLAAAAKASIEAVPSAAALRAKANGNGAAKPSIFDDPIEASPVFAEEKPVAKPLDPIPSKPVAIQKPDSLRSTLERMMQEQGHTASNGNGGSATAPHANGGAHQPPIRVAKSVPQTGPPLGSNGNGGAHPSHPGVRSASGATFAKPEAAPAAKLSIQEPLPQVSLFDPAAQEEKDAKGEYDTPAFLRRRRSIFE